MGRFIVKQDVLSGMWMVVDNMLMSVVDMWDCRPTARGVAKKLNKLDRVNKRED